MRPRNFTSVFVLQHLPPFFKRERRYNLWEMQVLHERFRENLRNILEDRALSQKEFAHLMHVSPEYVSQILRGYREPGLGVVDRVAAALEIDPHELLAPVREKIEN